MKAWHPKLSESSKILLNTFLKFKYKSVMKIFFTFFVSAYVISILSYNSANAQLTGSKTILGNYATIALAVADLNSQGVGMGGVTFNIAAGYVENISSAISITVSGNVSDPIIFQKSGAGANPLIIAYSTGTGTPVTAVQDGMWALVGSDYVTIDGIDLIDTNSTNPATMEYGYGLFKVSATNSCQNNTIKNCNITLNRINNAAAGTTHINII